MKLGYKKAIYPYNRGIGYPVKKVNEPNLLVILA